MRGNRGETEQVQCSTVIVRRNLYVEIIKSSQGSRERVPLLGVLEVSMHSKRFLTDGRSSLAVGRAQVFCVGQYLEVRQLGTVLYSESNTVLGRRRASFFVKLGSDLCLEKAPKSCVYSSTVLYYNSWASLPTDNVSNSIVQYCSTSVAPL